MDEVDVPAFVELDRCRRPERIAGEPLFAAPPLAHLQTLGTEVCVQPRNVPDAKPAVVGTLLFLSKPAEDCAIDHAAVFPLQSENSVSNFIGWPPLP